MKRLSVLFGLPVLVCALTKTPVPSPVDRDGNRPTLVEGMTLEDGTWAVQDSARRVWWSRDAGAHWAIVEPEQPDDNANLFVRHVLSANGTRYWTVDSGWKNASIPTACLQGSARRMNSQGFSGAFDRGTGLVTFCRTDDGFRTWRIWFTMDSSLTPATPKGGVSPIGSLDGGLVWYPVSDSGYIRGTGDGIHWFRSDLPPDIKVVQFYPMSPGGVLTIYGSKTGKDELVVAKSNDTGRTWSVKSESVPGALTATIGPDLYWSTNYIEPNKRNNWFARTPDGPWIWVDSGSSRGWLTIGSTLYMIEDSGIYRVGFDESGVSKATKPRKLSISVTARSIAIELPESMLGRSWRQMTMDGRALESGVANVLRLEIQRPRRPTMLQVGDLGVVLPPL